MEEKNNAANFTEIKHEVHIKLPFVLEIDEDDPVLQKERESHVKPAERYFADAHKHIYIQDAENLETYVNAYLKAWERLKIKKLALILPRTAAPSFEKRGFHLGMGCLRSLEENIPYLEFADSRPDIEIYLSLHHENPDLILVKKAFEYGAKGIKLHNAHYVIQNINNKIWFSDEWDKVFMFANENKIPVLFHVNHQDLLEDYLRLVEKYSDIPFIGANQLHLGWDILNKYFEQYPNFYVDTSVGCTVHKSDKMNEDHINELRKIFIKHHDRILFGTDEGINDYEPIDKVPSTNHTEWEEQHIRFLQQLNLPKQTLDDISHMNFNRLFSSKE